MVGIDLLQSHHTKQIANLSGLTRVLAKEVLPFNIRTLTAVLGTFNTSMFDAAQFGSSDLPEDYKGTMTETMIKALSSGALQPNGDKDKAMKAVFEAVAAEGAAGFEKASEKFLPLGFDMTARVKVVQDYLQHSLDTFGSVTNGVGLDK